MDNTFWLKQGSEPLFPELAWDKPERRDQAGKICVLGGNLHNLNAPAKAYEIIKQTGSSAVKIVLPDKTKSLVGKVMPEALFLPSTTSGEFSRDGEVELLEQLAWADTLLLPGDIGRNSETTILLEDCLVAYQDQVVLTKDAVDTLINNPLVITTRPNTTLVVSFAQLQKLVKNLGNGTSLAFSMDLLKFLDFLHEFTQKYPANIITLHQNQIIVAVAGKVSTTKLPEQTEPPHWRLPLASIISCYQTWHPTKAFEAISHAVYVFECST